MGMAIWLPEAEHLSRLLRQDGAVDDRPEVVVAVRDRIAAEVAGRAASDGALSLAAEATPAFSASASDGSGPEML